MSSSWWRKRQGAHHLSNYIDFEVVEKGERLTNIRKAFIYAFAVIALVCNSFAQQSTSLKVVGFMTDFDVKDDAVGICKAVMDGVAPGVRIIDITHQSEPYNIAMGARFLAGSAPYFPKDAVFVVVIDPGHGGIGLLRDDGQINHVGMLTGQAAGQLRRAAGLKTGDDEAFGTESQRRIRRQRFPAVRADPFSIHIPNT